MSKDEKGTILSLGSGAVAGSTSAVAGVIVGAAEGTAGAAALTSGLASVGSIVGGGMVSGIVVVGAAPIVVAALCLGIYKFYKRSASN